MADFGDMGKGTRHEYTDDTVLMVPFGKVFQAPDQWNNLQQRNGAAQVVFSISPAW